MAKKKRSKVVAVSGGQEITEEDIQRLADEAEAGYELDELRPIGRPPLGNGPSEVVTVRLDPELKAAVEERAEADSTTPSDVIRSAIRDHLKVA